MESKSGKGDWNYSGFLNIAGFFLYPEDLTQICNDLRIANEMCFELYDETHSQRVATFE